MRILIIEDEQEVASCIRHALLQDSHAVDLAPDGLAGEEMALSEAYDLIILDLMLPRKEGLAVLKTLRREGATTPILLLTARDDVSDRVRGLDAGADDYLGKPFAVTELQARARALLRRQTPTRSPELSAGDLLMDTAAHDVRLGETRLELTHREYAILEFLLRNKGRLLSKGMIAEHVWDYQYDGDFNLIEVYIRRLRLKLEQGSQPRLIHTVRNSGYIIREPEI
ncbi:MAG: response regulator [bacterium]